MFSEMDTDAFLAYAKAHHRNLVQQAERDALRRRECLLWHHRVVVLASGRSHGGR